MTESDADETERRTLRAHIAEQIKVTTNALHLDALTRAWANLAPRQDSGAEGVAAGWTLANAFEQLQTNAKPARQGVANARKGEEARKKRERERKERERKEE